MDGDGDPERAAPPGDGDSDGGGDPRATYDRIAAHFSATREYAWPEVETFLDGGEAATALDGEPSDDERTPPRALDLGCGNGRHSELLAERVDRVVGLDVSRGLLAEARERAADRDFAVELVHGDAATLPFADDAFDLSVFVATLHHLRPREQRVASLDELARVLSPGGRALISVWSTAHDRFDEDEGFDTTVDWTLPGGVRVPRYYHIYDPDEFEADLAASALSVVESVVSSGNCYAVVRPE